MKTIALVNSILMAFNDLNGLHLIWSNLYIRISNWSIGLDYIRQRLAQSWFVYFEY